MENSNITLKYHYTPFNELSLGGEVNFYGVIYDASFPIPDEFVPSRYECTLKIIDQSVNCLSNPSDLADKIINLIIKSDKKETIPYSHYIGDIIRIHRGNYVPKRKRNVYIQFDKNKQYNSSWCIFTGATDVLSREMIPYLCSHKNFTFENQDRVIIDNMRNWIKTYFLKPNSLFYGRDSKLIDRTTVGSDNDALIQIVHKQILEDKIVFFIQDETDGCELHTFKYFNFIEVNDVIRLRSFKVFNKNVILMNAFSNTLNIPQSSDYYKQFMNRLVLKLKEIQPNLDIPLFGTSRDTKVNNNKDGQMEIIDNYIVKAIVNHGQYDLKKYNEITPQDKRFLIEVNLIEIYPKPIYNFVNVLCNNCKTSYLISEIEIANNKFYCEKCQKEIVNDYKLHFNATIQCRETVLSNELITMHLCTYDDEGDNFFGLPPVDAYRDNNKFKILGEVFKKITDNRETVLVLVEQYENKILRIVGKYTNLVKLELH